VPLWFVFDRIACEQNTDKRMKIGLRLESLGLPFRRALQEAERLGVRGVQVDAVADLAGLSQTGRRELRHLLGAHNLELTALGCPLRRGLDVADQQEERIDRVRKALALSYDLGSRIVIIQTGKIPEDGNDPRSFRLREALLALAQAGDRVGAVLALETGQESGQDLRRFLDGFDTETLAVNFDPANLLMNGFDVLASLTALQGRIVHVHAKDARLAGANRVEVPLGAGDIEWLGLLGELEGGNYRGWLTIERESGDNRLADVAAGVAFLRRLVG
jgi:sugar phosphate isomerase/epimerase